MATELPKGRLQRPSRNLATAYSVRERVIRLTHHLICCNFYCYNNFFLHFNLHNGAICFLYFLLTRRLPP